jgi:hypothetical protein
MEWKASYFPIRPLTPEERGHGVEIKFRMSPGVCSCCGKPKFDHCYNCEKPVCRECAVPFVMLAHKPSGTPMIVLDICPECVADNRLETGPITATLAPIGKPAIIGENMEVRP